MLACDLHKKKDLVQIKKQDTILIPYNKALYRYSAYNYLTPKGLYSLIQRHTKGPQTYFGSVRSYPPSSSELLIA